MKRYEYCVTRGDVDMDPHFIAGPDGLGWEIVGFAATSKPRSGALGALYGDMLTYHWTWRREVPNEAE